LLYIFGGFDGLQEKFDLQIFNPVTLEWKKKPTTGEIPVSRTNHGAAAIGDFMYVYGGLLRDDTATLSLSDELYCLNTRTLNWTLVQTRGQKPPKLSAHKLVSIGKFLYLFGGACGNEESQKFNDLYILNTTTGEWVKPKCTGTVDASTFASVFTMGAFVFIYGGQQMSTTHVSTKVFMLDTIALHWSELEVLGVPPRGRDECPANVVGNNVILLHGYCSGPISSCAFIEVAPKILSAMTLPLETALS